MRIKLDFNSPEAIYIQLRNQIVMQIAQEQLHEGDSLPSVRGLIEEREQSFLYRLVTNQKR